MCNQMGIFSYQARTKRVGLSSLDRNFRGAISLDRNFKAAIAPVAPVVSPPLRVTCQYIFHAIC